jgi:peptidoglycan/LPS O-acetylase OafA/YrhL
MRARDRGLDGLRAAAALLVLFGHGGYFLFAALPRFELYALTSWIGTEIFFALGGFLVARAVLEAAADHIDGALRYTAWRLWRILPLFWLFLGVHVLLVLAAGRALPESLGAYPLLLQNAAWPHPAFFGEAWNLPLFVSFSLLMPGLALGLAPRPDARRWIAGVLGLLLLLGIALRAVWVFEQQPDWDEGVRKIVVARIDACLYGALLAVLLAGRGFALSRRAAAMVAIPALAVACALYLLLPINDSELSRIGAFVASGIGAAALCATCRGLIFPAPRVAAALARWSYALYLVNMPMLFGLTLLGLGQAPDAIQAVLRFVLWLLATLIVAAAVHRWIERPLLALGPSRREA